MRNSSRAILLSCGSLIGSLALSGVAAAQTPAAEEGNSGDVIVVMAQKRAENIQDVPIAVSAFSAELIETRNIDDTLDLQLLVPNLLIVGNDRPTLRGIGNNAISSTADNGTGSLVNFAPLGFRSQDEYFDIERVEVLRRARYMAATQRAAPSTC
jgi:iron complex outermembrane recepter protein